MARQKAFVPLALPNTFAPDALPPARLESLRLAAEALFDLHRKLAKTCDTVVGELIKTEERFFEWDHYPAGDVYDAETQSQFYYHAHPAKIRPEEEHGHFHTFLRPGGMPQGIRPAPVADAAVLEDPNDALSHLIAVSMNSRGLPIRLFTVNRWVTGEVWYEAADVIAMLDCFEIDHTQPSWPVNHWIGRIVRLFRPQIDALIRARDQALGRLMEQNGHESVLEDRDVEVISYCDISLEAQIDAVLSAKVAD